MLFEVAHAAGHPLRPKLRVASFDSVRGMVVAGIGIAVLPVSAITPYVAMGIRPVSLSDEWSRRTLRIVTGDAASIALPAAILRQFLIDKAVKA